MLLTFQAPKWTCQLAFWAFQAMHIPICVNGEVFAIDNWYTDQESLLAYSSLIMIAILE